MVLKSSALAISALNPALPARIRPWNGPLARSLTPTILLDIRVGMWLRVELCNIKLSSVEIGPIVHCKTHIGTNRVTQISRGKSDSVEEASNCQEGSPRERKPGIDLIVSHLLDLVAIIGSAIHTLNVRNNTNDRPAMVAALHVPRSSFAELLPSVGSGITKPTLVWCCIPMHHP